MKHWKARGFTSSTVKSPTLRSASDGNRAEIEMWLLRPLLGARSYGNASWRQSGQPYPIGSMVLLYMVTWIPSIYPIHVRIYTSTMDPMGMGSMEWLAHVRWDGQKSRGKRVLFGSMLVFGWGEEPHRNIMSPLRGPPTPETVPMAFQKCNEPWWSHEILISHFEVRRDMVTWWDHVWNCFTMCHIAKNGLSGILWNPEKIEAIYGGLGSTLG